MFAILLVSVSLTAPSGTITAAAGTGAKGYAGDGGPATAAQLDNPFDVAFDRAGHLYFSDTNNHVVRRVDAKTGIVVTVAGNGKKGSEGDGGPATAAQLNEPYGIELDAEGNLYIVDRLNFSIRVVDAKTRRIRTIAGTGKTGKSDDGIPGPSASLGEPNGLCLDGKGKLYIADVRDQRVRVLDLKMGTIGTACGLSGKKATAGDGGPIAKATLNGPRAVAMGRDGSLFIVEREGNGVRRIDFANGTIDRFAGTGKKGYSGDGGPANAATFDGPKEIDIDTNGNVFVVDTENEAIRRIDAKTGTVTTVAGKGRTKMPGQGDGGPATAATLGRPHGVAIGPGGAVYIGDTLSHRIRVVR
jgi:streptogramin lyase